MGARSETTTPPRPFGISASLALIPLAPDYLNHITTVIASSSGPVLGLCVNRSFSALTGPQRLRTDLPFLMREELFLQLILRPPKLLPYCTKV